MIKHLISSLLVFSVLVSCNSGSEDGKSVIKISKRDKSITPANAYNPLFFDSMKLVTFIADQKINDTLGLRMISFYNTRNYQMAWFTDSGLTEQARGFWNMHNYATTYGNDSSLKDKSLQKRMNGYTAEEDAFAVSTSDKNIINTELKLTLHFILYTLNNFEEGYVKRKEMERFIPVVKSHPMDLADSLISQTNNDDKNYEEINNSYKLLKDELEKYVVIAKQGGWQAITATAKQFKKGKSSPSVMQMKKRLQLSGDMAADTSALFNNELEAGIKKFQVRYGYKPTGILTDGLIKDMNVPVTNRIELILLNMGRMQWMVNEPKGEMIVVNIPEFILHYKDGAATVFEMPVVVGKEGHNTMMFTGNLNQVVFSPYWNLPESIVKKEIIPAIEKNSNYLAEHNMEITGYEDGVPVIRQLPGGDNSLGKVKFLFPNSFNIYFHDTPAKDLFKNDKRAYSHGCIRLSDPVKMARYLLKDDKKWTPEKIDTAMNSEKEKYVKLDKPVPVLITYYTAWVDGKGLLHFADDIYGHDKVMVQKMFTGR